MRASAEQQTSCRDQHPLQTAAHHFDIDHCLALSSKLPHRAIRGNNPGDRKNFVMLIQSVGDITMIGRNLLLVFTTASFAAALLDTCKNELGGSSSQRRDAIAAIR